MGSGASTTRLGGCRWAALLVWESLRVLLGASLNGRGLAQAGSSLGLFPFDRAGGDFMALISRVDAFHLRNAGRSRAVPK